MNHYLVIPAHSHILQSQIAHSTGLHVTYSIDNDIIQWSSQTYSCDKVLLFIHCHVCLYSDVFRSIADKDRNGSSMN